jgi:hypothetical protein
MNRNIKLMEIGGGNLWDQFVKLYNKMFTNPLEWENPEEWKTKLSYNDTPENLPVIHVLVAVHETSSETQEVVGGIVFEHHRRSHVGFMTYLAVAAQWRKHGLSKSMLSEAIKTLSNIESSNNGELFAFIGDTENPDVVPDEQSCMPTNARYQVMQRLGGQPLDFSYIQPKLVGGGGVCRHLMLWSFDISEYGDNCLTSEVLINFLKDEYRSLGIMNPETDEDFVEMVSSIDEEILCSVSKTEQMAC